MSVKRTLKRRSSPESKKSFQQSNSLSLTSPKSEFVNLVYDDMTEVIENDTHKVYNCGSSISQNLLDGRSDAIRLPSIHELDMMNDSSDCMVHALDDRKLKWLPSESASLSLNADAESCMTQRALKQRRLYPSPEPRQQQQPAQCHACGSTETPEWRKGPLGPRTLCNACGLIWIKEEKKRNKKKKQTHTTEPCSVSDSQATETPNKYTLSFLLC